MLGLRHPPARPVARSSATCWPASSSGRTRRASSPIRHLAEQLAEVGVILLMFGVGLHFHLEDLLAGRAASPSPAPSAQSLVATVLGDGGRPARSAGAGRPASSSAWPSSVASTVVLIRVLTDNDDLHTPTGHIAVGWLVVEDLFTVLVLVLLPASVGGRGRPAAGGIGPGAAGGRHGRSACWSSLTVLVVGDRVIPWLLDAWPRTALARAVHADGAGRWRSASPSARRSCSASRWRWGRSWPAWSSASRTSACGPRPRRCRCATPSPCCSSSRSACCSTPGTSSTHAGLLAATLAVILIGKPLAALAHRARSWATRSRPALAVAVALAQIGEFSFILATLGTQLGVLPAAATNALVAAAIVSITLNPLLYRLVEPAAAWLVAAACTARDRARSRDRGRRKSRRRPRALLTAP